MDKQFTFKPVLRYLAYALIAIGLITIIAGFIFSPERTYANILLNNFYFLSLGIGGAFFLALQYITQSGWSAAFKRIPESMSMFIPIGGIIMILLVIFGAGTLYPWVNPELAGFDDHEMHILHHKAGYLNLPFFIIRMLVFLIVWVWLILTLRKFSLKEDMEGGLVYFKKTEFFSKVFIFVLAFTFSLASFDWIMSLNPIWYSTIYSLKNFLAAFFHGSAIIVLVVIIMTHYGYFPFVNNAHWHDFSKYIFILATLWGYFWFSQYLLIWYANIPEETMYYVIRLEGNWEIIFYLNIILNWGLPFVVLLSNYFAKKKTVLGIVILFLIIGQWMDLYEQIMPERLGDVSVGYLEIGSFLGFAGLFFYIFARMLSRASLIPTNHPYLNESIEHSGH
jgi:hypothetical protein